MHHNQFYSYGRIQVSLLSNYDSHWMEFLQTGLTLCCLLRRTESTYRHQANIDDEVVAMEILDTAGQVREIIPPLCQIFVFEKLEQNNYVKRAF